MKYLVTALALLASTTIASAGNPKQALGYAVVVVYDSQCEKLRPDFMEITRIGFGLQSMEDLSTAEKTVQDLINRLGLEGFCNRSKPLVAYGIGQLDQLIEEYKKKHSEENK